MSWLFFTLLAASFWGIGQVVVKKGLGEISPLLNNVITIGIYLVLFIPFALIGGVSFPIPPQIYLLGLLSAIGMLCYYYVLDMGEVSLIGTIISAYPLITVVLSLIFLRENPSIFQKIAIILVLVGAVLIALPEKLTSLKKIKMKNWFWWAVVGALTIGVADFLAKVSINQTNVSTYVFAYSIGWIVAVTVSAFVDKKGRVIPKVGFKKYVPTLIGVVMIESGLLFFYIALSKGLASLVGPISSLYAAITVILAWFFLKERITKLQIIGIAFSISGIILIGIS